MANLADMEREAGNFASELFARGFIISDAIPVHPSGWSETAFGGWRIAHHPRVAVQQSSTGSGSRILCLGIIFDTRAVSTTQSEYLDLLARALARSEDEMLAELSHSNGRYILLYCTAEGHSYLLTDATGMRCALFCSVAHRTIASHLELVALDAGIASRENDRQSKFGFPGRQTPFRGVYLLTPNTKLNLATMKPERYWPMTALPRMELAAAANLVAERLEKAYHWITSNFDAFVTITAGLDSRVTLSIAKTDGRYATYYRNDEADTDKIDRDTTLAMAARFGLDHTLLGPETREAIPKDYLKVLKFNTYRPHLPRMTYAYKQHMIRDPDRVVHIRSNLSEIGRMFYKRVGSNPLTSEDLLKLWSREPSLRSDGNRRLFEEYAETTDFFSAPVEKTSLFYWEHRMGCWHSQVTTESDIVCESLSLYNNRHLLSAMLSVEPDLQKRSILLKKIIIDRWPELADFPVNGKPFAPPKAYARLLVAPSPLQARLVRHLAVWIGAARSRRA